MDDSVIKLEKLLKNAGYSVTTSRLAVFRYLFNKESVPVASVTRALEQTTNRASVYRTIKLFQQLGIVIRHNIGWKYKIELSDMFSEHHHHFTCIRCGKVVPMSEQLMEGFVDTLSKRYDFVTTEHQIEIQGYCSDCKTLASRN